MWAMNTRTILQSIPTLTNGYSVVIMPPTFPKENTNRHTYRKQQLTAHTYIYTHSNTYIHVLTCNAYMHLFRVISSFLSSSESLEGIFPLWDAMGESYICKRMPKMCYSSMHSNHTSSTCSTNTLSCMYCTNMVAQ